MTLKRLCQNNRSYTRQCVVLFRSHLLDGRRPPLFVLQHSRLRSSVEITVGEVEGSECNPSSELVLLKKGGVARFGRLDLKGTTHCRV